MTLEEMKSELLKLPEMDRADLAHLLISSLDEPYPDHAQEEIDSAWIDESESRLNDLLEGRVKGVDARVALQRTRERLEARQKTT